MRTTTHDTGTGGSRGPGAMWIQTTATWCLDEVTFVEHHHHTGIASQGSRVNAERCDVG